MRWTADNDQLLFLKLIETHDVSVKPQKIQYVAIGCRSLMFSPTVYVYSLDPANKNPESREAWPRDGREIPTARAISERIVKLRNTIKTASTDATSSLPASSTQTTPRKRKNVQDNGGTGSSESNGHLQGDSISKEHESARKRRRRPGTPPGFVKEELEDGSFTPFPPGFGIFGAERWGDEHFRRRIKAEERNSEGVGEEEGEGEGEGGETGTGTGERNELGRD
ncbi:hypothetical protein C7212DRAFT_348073 [Tuber magnatum]|uniref:Uncharacterized protein n=1 Tax=Tuber magnatum TaxID=42249 RepID=A0A317SH02_9PEZI|nr:hypothetical protein C7212DRAFT_348073 [Tuber magnatum]